MVIELSGELTEAELEIAAKINSAWIRFQIANFSANGAAFYILGFLGLINLYTLTFLVMFCLSLFFGARRILRERLDTQGQKVLDRLRHIP